MDASGAREGSGIPPSLGAAGPPGRALALPPIVLSDGCLALQCEDIPNGFSTLYLVEDEKLLESVTVEGEILQLSRLR